MHVTTFILQKYNKLYIIYRTKLIITNIITIFTYYNTNITTRIIHRTIKYTGVTIRIDTYKAFVITATIATVDT